MKNSLLIIIVIVAVLGIGGYMLSQKPSQSDSVMKDETPVQKEETMMEKTDETGNNSRYIEYSKEILANSTGSRRVLFFYASWCSTCRPADANFRENIDKIPDDVTLIRVNYSDPETDQDEKDLAKKYGITYQHTFVQIDSTEKEITKWNGGQTDELLTNLK